MVSDLFRCRILKLIEQMSLKEGIIAVHMRAVEEPVSADKFIFFFVNFVLQFTRFTLDIDGI